MAMMMTQEQAGQAIRQATEEALTAWLAFERLEGKSERTIAAYRQGLELYQTWAEARRLDGRPAMPSDIRQFKADLLDRGYSPQTVNLRLAAVRSFYRFAVNTDRLPYNPAAEVKGAKRHKSTRHKRDALTAEEVRAVLDTCEPTTPEGIRDRAILTLMAYCGLRTVEIHRANLGNLRTQGERLTLEVQGKGRDEADEVVVIPRDQERHIRAWVSYRNGLRFRTPDAALFCSLSNRSRGDRLALRSIRAIVTARYEAAGVVGDNKTTHSLRHSAITNAIRNGASPMQVQAMARHSSFDTTLNYVHEVDRIDNPAEDLISY